MDKDILDVEGAATLLGVSPRTIYTLARKGEIPATRVGREWRFARQNLIACVANGSQADQLAAVLRNGRVARGRRQGARVRSRRAGISSLFQVTGHTRKREGKGMATEHVDVPLEPALRQQLAALAQETDRSEAALLGEAVAQFLEFHRWQRARIDQPLAAADRGDVATPEDVDRVFATYRPHPERCT